MSEFNNLKLEIADQTAVLSISRPAALNALNSETLDELNTALTEIEAMDDVKVVILTGGPDKKGNEFKSFVAGADISEMVNFTAPEARAFGIKASVPFFKLMNCVRLPSLLSTVLLSAADVRSLWRVISVSHPTMLFSDSRSAVLVLSLDSAVPRDLPVLLVWDVPKK